MIDFYTEMVKEIVMADINKMDIPDRHKRGWPRYYVSDLPVSTPIEDSKLLLSLPNHLLNVSKTLQAVGSTDRRPAYIRFDGYKQEGVIVVLNDSGTIEDKPTNCFPRDAYYMLTKELWREITRDQAYELIYPK